MAERQWTPQQEDAIAARGGTVLVSAAAGSGKTAVLVERVVGRILDEKNPVDADRLLIVTFSNAAALEMKQRIMARMSELIAAHPEDRRLRRQPKRRRCTRRYPPTQGPARQQRSVHPHPTRSRRWRMCPFQSTVPQTWRTCRLR